MSGATTTAQSVAPPGRDAHLAGAAGGTATVQARPGFVRVERQALSVAGGQWLPDKDEAYPLPVWLKCALRRVLNIGYFLCRKLYC
ncbi:hypothetical protein [Vogesella indigofera]|uniref:hypothetical protein n=1 Tax=Vogesella indigofera TaxID=45465 RepID=UPI003F42200C